MKEGKTLLKKGDTDRGEGFYAVEKKEKSENQKGARPPQKKIRLKLYRVVRVLNQKSLMFAKKGRVETSSQKESLEEMD